MATNLIFSCTGLTLLLVIALNNPSAITKCFSMLCYRFNIYERILACGLYFPQNNKLSKIAVIIINNSSPMFIVHYWRLTMCLFTDCQNHYTLQLHHVRNVPSGPCVEETGSVLTVDFCPLTVNLSQAQPTF